MVARLLWVVARQLLSYLGWLLRCCYAVARVFWVVTRWLVVVTDGHYEVYIELIACC